MEPEIKFRSIQFWSPCFFHDATISTFNKKLSNKYRIWSKCPIFSIFDMQRVSFLNTPSPSTVIFSNNHEMKWMSFMYGLKVAFTNQKECTALFVHFLSSWNKIKAPSGLIERCDWGIKLFLSLKLFYSNKSFLNYHLNTELCTVTGAGGRSWDPSEQQFWTHRNLVQKQTKVGVPVLLVPGCVTGSCPN